jgi:hypothetical protein
MRNGCELPGVSVLVCLYISNSPENLGTGRTAPVWDRNLNLMNGN